MSLQTINLGNYANDGTGDDLRTAFQKVNANFAELYGEAAISTAVNLGSGTGIFADKNGINLEFKSVTSTDSSVTITSTDQTVNLKANTKLESDLNPKLGANLNLNGFNIFGGDTQTSVYGINVQLLSATLQVLLESGNITIDLGTFSEPTGYQSTTQFANGYDLDMGIWTFGDPAPQNQLNFGNF